MIGLDVIPDSGQNVPYTATAGNTTDLPVGTTNVLIWTTSDAYVKVGRAAVANNNDCPLPGSMPIVIGVQEPNASDNRVSAVQITAAGTLFVQPLAGE